uniref:RRM domain-containing protein n=1 Tax=Leersia perrieri TaxID=77586 RepID=A0A0D9V9E7_9ORYZ
MDSNVRIMYDKNSGRSRGFGFIHFSSEYEAKCAKDAMDGKVMLGRPLRISFALDKVRGAPVIVPRLSTVVSIAHHSGWLADDGVTES